MNHRLGTKQYNEKYRGCFFTDRLDAIPGGRRYCHVF